MFLTSSVLISVCCCQLVLGNLLFRKGWVKTAGHSRRSFEVKNVEFIDEKLLSDNGDDFLLVRATMPILYKKSLRNMPGLQNVSLVECKIQSIEPGAFFNLPQLTVLHLHDNDLEEIREGVFSKLQLRILTLQRNHIKTIEPGAFDDMPNLTKIKMSNNKLKMWDSHWFKNTPQLLDIYFRRNKLRVLPEAAFANIKGSHVVNGQLTADTRIYLSKNRLAHLDPASFNGMESMGQIFLDRNKISDLPEGLFRDLREVDVLYLARNRITNVSEGAFPKLTRVGILDLSSNLLDCVPYRLVAVANLTELKQNNDTCACMQDIVGILKNEEKISLIHHDCEDVTMIDL